jgi:hypothetical protein
MSDASDNAGSRDRSPAFPSIPLEVALRRLVEFENHFKRSAARPTTVGEAWGLKSRASADRVAAALRYFGLLEYQGIGDARQIVMSDEGRKYLRAQQDSVKGEVIRLAAVRPKQIAIFWAEWGTDRPADAACLDELVLKHGFSDGGSRDFLKVYDATIAFAGLSDSGKMPIIERASNEAPMAPARHDTAVQRTDDLGVVANRLLDEVVTSVQYPKAKGTMLQETFYLDEGPVTLSFPSTLSGESYEDLKDQLELFLRRAQRRSGGKALSAKAASVTQSHEAIGDKGEED